MTYREMAKELHESVNHKYDGHPYVLHLDAVKAVHNEFSNTIKNKIGDSILEKAIYFHDAQEDCRLTYNNIKEIIGEEAAEIVYAVTNNKGRTRAERADNNYYLNIRKTPGAAYVKLCDRIANVRYSRMMGSSMYRKYKAENDHFMIGVGADEFPEMKECLINLFK